MPGTSLANLFVTYRLYWTESEMRYSFTYWDATRNYADHGPGFGLSGSDGIARRYS